jgi:hypothetical protein
MEVADIQFSQGGAPYLPSLASGSTIPAGVTTFEGLVESFTVLIFAEACQ